MNFGGLPEMRRAGFHTRLRKLVVRAGRAAHRLVSPPAGCPVPAIATEFLDQHHYPVFDHADEVPDEAFSNPRFIVERFLREPSQEGYSLRSYNFLGDLGFTRRRVSDQPIVKASNSRLLDAPPVPPQLDEMRQKLGFDFGKIDFLEIDGAPVVLDINTTPTVVDGSEQLARDLLSLAPGIDSVTIDG